MKISSYFYSAAVAVVFQVGPVLGVGDCGCSSCTSSALDKDAGGFKVRDRIDWVIANMGQSETDACGTVCGDEFQGVCGSECNPNQCGGAGGGGGRSRCGCSSCITSVIERDAGGFPVGSRIDWVMANLGRSEEDACDLVCGVEYSDVCDECDCGGGGGGGGDPNCGGGSRGNGVCSDGTCCSQYGWCGTSSEHCSGNPPSPTPPFPSPTPLVGTCGGGNQGDGVCSDGTCCSQYGWCGTSSEHCSGNPPSPTPPSPTPPTGGSGPCDILTPSIFDEFTPNRNSLYSYQGFCNAVVTWNRENPFSQIFMGSTVLQRRQELAAFFGNMMHESASFSASREFAFCRENISRNGVVYCKPAGYNGGPFNHPYCDPGNGCSCSTIVPESSISGYVEASKLFIGRGPIQLSWNFNYIDAGAALGVDLCANPDLVATNEENAWKTAIWFWLTRGGRSGRTCHDSVIINGDFGGTLDTINGGLECPAVATHQASVVQRMDLYCKATRALDVGLMSLTGCNGLQAVFNNCRADSTCRECQGL